MQYIAFFLLFFNIIIARCDPIASQTVWVDNGLGNDATGQLEDPSLAFKTLNAAIITVQSQPTETSGWLLIVRPGFYNEVVTLPGNINIYGSGDLSIINGLVINGAATVEHITIETTNALSILINGNTSNIFLTDVTVTSTWNTKGNTLNTNYILVQHVSGNSLFTDVSMTALTSSAMNNTSFIALTSGNLTLNDCNTVITANALVDNFAVYDSSVSTELSSDYNNLYINFGSTKVQSKASNNIVFIRSVNVNHEFYASRIHYDLKNTVNSAVISATSGLTLKFSGLSFNFKTPPVNLLLIQGFADNLGNAPDVRVDGCMFVKTPIPPSSGTFANYSITASTTEGFLTTGGIQLGIKNISSNYAIQSNDAILIVTSSNVIVTLPVPTLISPGTLASGRIIYIRNNSTGLIYISNAVTNLITPVISGITAQFFCDEVYWYRIIDQLL